MKTGQIVLVSTVLVAGCNHSHRGASERGDGQDFAAMEKEMARPFPTAGGRYMISSVIGDSRCLQDENQPIIFEMCHADYGSQHFTLAARGPYKGCQSFGPCGSKDPIAIGTQVYMIKGSSGANVCHEDTGLSGGARQVINDCNFETSLVHGYNLWRLTQNGDGSIRVHAVSYPNELDHPGMDYCWDRRSPDASGRLQIIPCNFTTGQNFYFGASF